MNTLQQTREFALAAKLAYEAAEIAYEEAIDSKQEDVAADMLLEAQENYAAAGIAFFEASL